MMWVLLVVGIVSLLLLSDVPRISTDSFHPKNKNNDNNGINYREYVPPKIVKISMDDMRSWGYDEVSLCIIMNSTKASPYSVDQLHDICLKENNLPLFTPRPPFQHGMEGLWYGSSLYREVCKEDVPLKDRGFDEVVEGYENGNDNKHLLTTFLELSARNMSIIIIGDSINNQFSEAMKFEIDRCQAGTFQYYVKESLWWLDRALMGSIGVPPSDIFDMPWLLVHVWTPFSNQTLRNSPPNPVYMYTMHVREYDGSLTYMGLYKRLLPYLVAQIHLQGMLVLASQGHHLGEERKSYFNGNRMPMWDRMNALVTFLHDLSTLNANAVIAFRETSPAHFNSPALDGSYERYMASPASKSYDWSKPNSWDGTMYYCRAIQNLSIPELSQTPENLVARRVIHGAGYQNSVHILSVFEYLAPFYKLKFGNCGYGGRLAILDCVHYAANHPAMWAPVWHGILELLLKGIDRKGILVHGNVNSAASSIDSEKGNMAVSWRASTQWAAANLVQNGTDYFLQRGSLLHPVSSEAYFQLFQRSINSVSAINLSDIMNRNLVVSFPASRVTNNSLVVLGGGYCVAVDGKIHAIRSWDVVLNRGYDKLRSVIRSPTAEWLDSLPFGKDITTAVANASLVLAGRRHYIFIDNTMRFVPDIRVIKQVFGLNLDLKSAVTISEDTLYEYPLGPSLPYLNASLIIYDRGFYYYVNEQVRWIPDMDTFYSLKLGQDQGVQLSAKEFNSLPQGPPWPKCYC